MLGTVTASIDLANDVTQAPIDNTTMIMDLVGVGAGLFGGRGIENGTTNVIKNIDYKSILTRVFSIKTIEAKSITKEIPFNTVMTEPSGLQFVLRKHYQYSPYIPNSKALPGVTRPQRHHILQDAWAKTNLKAYGYDSKLAPTVTIETKEGSAHAIITKNQRLRMMQRLNNGLDKFGTSLEEELANSKSDLLDAGFSTETTNAIMQQVDKMINHLGVK